ncbi:Metallo-hydrolase/oxidoreductase [Hymenopellis radicata]|nr:Metallo-hydrolase/oxidoreductase [Hymenopellis radicata]
MESTRNIRSGPINVTFLGTVSAAPTSTRRHSALTLRMGGDVWLFDCGEGTQTQLQRSSILMGGIEKIFITHTHGDHIFGLVPLMCALLDGNGGAAEGEDPRLTQDGTARPLEIYGPLGTRAYIRNCLKYTYAALQESYVVHELRFPKDPRNDFTFLPPHRHELPGRNIEQEDGVWHVYDDGVVSVSAAPIRHSVPCVGYVVKEAYLPGKIDPKLYIPAIKKAGDSFRLMSKLQRGETVKLSDGTVLQGPAHRPGRKIVVLGDTYNPSKIAPLAMDADLLIHEATNAHLPDIGIPLYEVDGETFESVEKRAKSRGHSTPQMAGAFARTIRAKQLIMNHFSGRYAGDDDVNEESMIVMDAIADLAKTEYDGGVLCARDLMSYDVVVPK